MMAKGAMQTLWGKAFHAEGSAGMKKLRHGIA
jgi:hypothetical protein